MRLRVLLALGLAACGGAPPLTDCSPLGALTPTCGFQNPEDVVLAPAGGWLIVSQFRSREKPGSLVAFRPSDGEKRILYPSAEGTPAAPHGGECGEPPPTADFSPHGIDLAGARLLVVNHGGEQREAIEEFLLLVTPEGPHLGWMGCTLLPPDAAANDVAALPEGFLATNMMGRSQTAGGLKLAVGLPVGEVLHFDGSKWAPIPGTAGGAPNGIAVGPDGAIYFAEWGARRIARVQADGTARTETALDFHPDNLSWASDGRLLVAGQRGSTFSVVGCGSIQSGACALPSVVVAVDPATLAATSLVNDDPPTRIGAASVAVELDDALWIGSFASDRLVKRAGTH
jgi:hypothetical protein